MNLEGATEVAMVAATAVVMYSHSQEPESSGNMISIHTYNMAVDDVREESETRDEQRRYPNCAVTVRVGTDPKEKSSAYTYAPLLMPSKPTDAEAGEKCAQTDSAWGGMNKTSRMLGEKFPQIGPMNARKGTTATHEVPTTNERRPT